MENGFRVFVRQNGTDKSFLMKQWTTKTFSHWLPLKGKGPDLWNPVILLPTKGIGDLTV